MNRRLAEFKFRFHHVEHVSNHYLGQSYKEDVKNGYRHFLQKATVKIDRKENKLLIIIGIVGMLFGLIKILIFYKIKSLSKN